MVAAATGQSMVISFPVKTSCHHMADCPSMKISRYTWGLFVSSFKQRIRLISTRMVTLYGELDIDAPGGRLSMSPGDIPWRILFVLSVLWVIWDRLAVKKMRTRNIMGIFLFHCNETIQGCIKR